MKKLINNSNNPIFYKGKINDFKFLQNNNLNEIFVNFFYDFL